MEKEDRGDARRIPLEWEWNNFTAVITYARDPRASWRVEKHLTRTKIITPRLYGTEVVEGRGTIHIETGRKEKGGWRADLFVQRSGAKNSAFPNSSSFYEEILAFFSRSSYVSRHRR